MCKKEFSWGLPVFIHDIVYFINTYSPQWKKCQGAAWVFIFVYQVSMKNLTKERAPKFIPVLRLLAPLRKEDGPFKMMCEL